jgi:hypothetical protein
MRSCGSVSAVRRDHARSYDIRDYAARLVKLWREVANNRQPLRLPEPAGRALQGTVQTAPKI